MVTQQERNKNIWIINHYATNMFHDKGGRHYWFAEKLIEKGYNPTIICASTNHFSKNEIPISKGVYKIEYVEGIRFIFVKTPKYDRNGFKRILNMFAFYFNVLRINQSIISEAGTPKSILASSVHPLTLLAGIKMSNSIGSSCICEVRDLWPESLVAYQIIKEDTILAKLLYLMERKIYIKSESIIMTWEGGKDYIQDKGWEQEIDLSKIYHISNGIRLDKFDFNTKNKIYTDFHLDDEDYKNIVYTGSIRKVNDLSFLLDTASIIKNEDESIRFLIYGDGEERIELEERCKIEKIDNVVFKGKVKKDYIPSILTKSYANILHNKSTSLDKYGQSQNKFYEYLAAGKCVIQTYSTGFSVLDKYDAGITAPIQDSAVLAKLIIEICNDELKAEIMGINARKLAYQYDFEILTDKLIKIL